ncbi:MAG TPA: helix-turn-helix domain-containing protein [Candidatus Sulfotelmatobacter sp.]|nr:helix-turn-helix domain-containing protein [Candidatus Sulfotelmatobacter sp.]
MPQRQTERALRARDKRRKELLQAATQVFARRGYRAASINDIIQAADVARGTFYIYFRSKQDIFAAIVANFREEEKPLILADQEDLHATRDNLRMRTRDSVLRWLEFYFRNLDAAKIVIRDANMVDPSATRKREAVRRAVKSSIAENFAHRQRLGLYRHSISPQLASHFMLGMFDEIAATQLQHARKSDLGRIADQYVDFLLHGVLLP